MTVALYTTIWLSLVCLLIGELGRRNHRNSGLQPMWAISGSAIGVALGVAHTLIALGVAYHWDHDRAVHVTAARAATVYGVAWPGSLYVNYLFLAWWAADVIWWWRAPVSFIRRASAADWLWRLTAFTMVVNGAVVFASPIGRLAGAPLVAGLLTVWWHDRLSTRRSS